MVANNLLNELPKERIFLEIQKLLLKSSSPSSGIELLKKLGAFNFFVEFKDLGINDYNTTLKSIDKMSFLLTSNEARNTILMLSVLCHKLTIKNCENLLLKLTTNRGLINKVLKIIEYQNSLNFINFTDYDIYLLATKINLEEFIYFSKAITTSQIILNNILRLKTRANELGVLNTKAKALLQGKDILNLGIKPSKDFSNILEKAYLAQISGDFTTKEQALVWLKKFLFT